MAHQAENHPPVEGEKRTALAGLREVDAPGHAQRLQQIALQHCLEKLGGRVEIPRSAIENADLTRNIVIRGDVSSATGDPVVVIELR